MSESTQRRNLRKAGLLCLVIVTLGSSWLQADSESRSSSMRVHYSAADYQTLKAAEEFSTGEGYITAPVPIEREGFTIESLRKTLTQTSETKYVDVARFHGIRARAD